MSTTEEWRPVPSVPLLEASSEGRIRSIPYETSMPSGGIKINRMSPTYGITVFNSKNYCRKQVVFRRKTYRVHRLVAEAFLGILPENLITSHIDENALNNKVSNLEYISRQANHNKPKLKEYQRAACPVKMQGLSYC